LDRIEKGLLARQLVSDGGAVKSP